MSTIKIYDSHENEAQAINFIKEKCLNYIGKDPIELAVEIMNDEIIRMHGPEHHFLVPAVLTTCVHNHHNDKKSLKEKLEIADRRSKLETPRVCTFKKGSCGAAQGTGVFMSMFLERGELDEDAWSPSNSIITESLKVIDESNGPRCCKRDTYIAIETAAKFLRERFSVNLPVSEGRCTFSLRNDDCGHEDCEYYNLANSLV
jgi:hypothetical protein